MSVNNSKEEVEAMVEYNDQIRPVETSPLATDNLLENTDRVLRPPISVLLGRHPATF